MFLPQALGQGEGDTLREAAGVHEDEGGPVGLDELSQLVVRVRPLLSGSDRLKVPWRDHHPQVQVALLPGVHDFAVGCAVRADMVCPHEELGCVLDGIHRGREAHAGRALAADMI